MLRKKKTLKKKKKKINTREDLYEKKGQRFSSLPSSTPGQRVTDPSCANSPCFLPALITTTCIFLLILNTGFEVVCYGNKIKGSVTKHLLISHLA